MELESLPGGDPESAVGVLIGDPLQGEVLVGGHDAGRNGDPDHEGVGLLRSGDLAPAPLVPGILLVGPVELEQLDVVVLEVRGIGRQRLRDAAA